MDDKIKYKKVHKKYIQKLKSKNNGVFMKIVTIFIQNNQKEFLIQKRSPQKNGKYGITSGHANPDESPEQAAIREIKEELGISLKKDQLKLFYTTKEKQETYYLYFLKKEIDLAKLILQKEEVESVKWCTIEEIENLIKNREFFETQIEAYEIAKKIIKI